MKTNELLVKLIEKTKNPLAPILVQELATAITNARVLFDCDLHKTVEIQERLLKDFPDSEIDALSAKPEFVTALLIMLYQSMIGYTVTE